MACLYFIKKMFDLDLITCVASAKLRLQIEYRNKKDIISSP